MCSALSPPSASRAPGTEQCLFRLWEKTLCKQQSVNVVTSPLKIASLYLFSYPLCFHHLLPPTLIAAMPELLFLAGCCRHELKRAHAEAAQECLVLQSLPPGEGGPGLAAAPAPNRSPARSLCCPEARGTFVSTAQADLEEERQGKVSVRPLLLQ